MAGRGVDRPQAQANPGESGGQVQEGQERVAAQGVVADPHLVEPLLVRRSGETGDALERPEDVEDHADLHHAPSGVGLVPKSAGHDRPESRAGGQPIAIEISRAAAITFRPPGPVPARRSARVGRRC